MTKPVKATKPAKPYPEFPLFAHARGQWAKKINGRLHYFGSWSAGWQAALEEYTKQRDYLFAGTTPPVEGTQLRDVMNSFHRAKKAALEQGDLAQRSFDEYQAVCDTIAATINKTRPMTAITRDDLDRLRGVLTKGKGGQRISPSSAKRLLTMARSVFYHANEECGCSIKYKQPLRSPSSKEFRKARHQIGERLFEPAEVSALLDIAGDQLKAMIYLGINCGFGNRDCATLQIEDVDLAKGWHHHPRPKTNSERRCPLWDETAAALYAVIKNRTEGDVFQTSAGNPWFSNKVGTCPISAEFRKLTQKLEIFRPGVNSFYTLRRTFQTVGELAGEPKALQFIMGHLPSTGDMSAVYRQKYWDSSLRKVTEAVHKWLFNSGHSLKTKQDDAA